MFWYFPDLRLIRILQKMFRFSLAGKSYNHTKAAAYSNMSPSYARECIR